MRSAQKSNRQRGRGNRKPNGNSVNRVFDSSGPEGKVRGTAQQIIEKYLSLARDAQTSGDRVVAENFLQHAEHYQRLLLAATAAQQQDRRDGDGDGQGQDSGDGGDDGDEPEQRYSDDRPPRRHRTNGGAQHGQGRDVDADDAGGALATIDTSGEDSESLLVPTENVGASQPAPAAPAPAAPRKRRRTTKTQKTEESAASDGENADTAEAEGS